MTDWTEQEIEARANDLPPYIPPLPGIDPSISQAPDLFDAEHTARFGVSLARAAIAGTEAAMVAAAVALLGTTEHPPGSNHNDVTLEYNREIAPSPIGDGPWCDMGVSVEANRSGNIDAVCGGPRRGFAYTPAHAAWFRSVGRWHYGLGGIQPGDIVFFNWSGRKTIDSIEHVGVVEHRYADGTIATIECNIGDECRREHRDATYVVGYGRPPYNAQEDEMPIRTSLGKTKDQDLAWGTFTTIDWDTEYGDPSGAHSDGDYPGYVPPKISSWADMDCSIQVTGLQPGDYYQLRYEVHDWANGKPAGDPWTEVHADAPATTGDQYIAGTFSKWVGAGQHVYVAIAVFPAGGDAKGRPAPKAVSGRWTVRQDQS